MLVCRYTKLDSIDQRKAENPQAQPHVHCPSLPACSSDGWVQVGKLRGALDAMRSISAVAQLSAPDSSSTSKQPMGELWVTWDDPDGGEEEWFQEF